MNQMIINRHKVKLPSVCGCQSDTKGLGDEQWCRFAVTVLTRVTLVVYNVLFVNDEC